LRAELRAEAEASESEIGKIEREADDFTKRLWAEQEEEELAR